MRAVRRWPLIAMQVLTILALLTNVRPECQRYVLPLVSLGMCVALVAYGWDWAKRR